jgi:hypothetical protein
MKSEIFLVVIDSEGIENDKKFSEHTPWQPKPVNNP